MPRKNPMPSSTKLGIKLYTHQWHTIKQQLEIYGRKKKPSPTEEFFSPLEIAGAANHHKVGLPSIGTPGMAFPFQGGLKVVQKRWEQKNPVTKPESFEVNQFNLDLDPNTQGCKEFACECYSAYITWEARELTTSTAPEMAKFDTKKAYTTRLVECLKFCYYYISYFPNHSDLSQAYEACKEKYGEVYRILSAERGRKTMKRFKDEMMNQAKQAWCVQQLSEEDDNITDPTEHSGRHPTGEKMFFNDGDTEKLFQIFLCMEPNFKDFDPGPQGPEYVAEKDWLDAMLDWLEHPDTDDEMKQSCAWIKETEWDEGDTNAITLNKHNKRRIRWKANEEAMLEEAKRLKLKTKRTEDKVQRKKAWEALKAHVKEHIPFHEACMSAIASARPAYRAPSEINFNRLRLKYSIAAHTQNSEARALAYDAYCKYVHRYWPQMENPLPLPDYKPPTVIMLATLVHYGDEAANGSGTLVHWEGEPEDKGKASFSFFRTMMEEIFPEMLESVPKSYEGFLETASAEDSPLSQLKELKAIMSAPETPPTQDDPVEQLKSLLEEAKTDSPLHQLKLLLHAGIAGETAATTSPETTGQPKDPATPAKPGTNKVNVVTPGDGEDEQADESWDAYIKRVNARAYNGDWGRQDPKIVIQWSHPKSEECRKSPEDAKGLEGKRVQSARIEAIKKQREQLEVSRLAAAKELDPNVTSVPPIEYEDDIELLIVQNELHDRKRWEKKSDEWGVTFDNAKGQARGDLFLPIEHCPEYKEEFETHLKSIPPPEALRDSAHDHWNDNDGYAKNVGRNYAVFARIRLLVDGLCMDQRWTHPDLLMPTHQKVAPVNAFELTECAVKVGIELGFFKPEWLKACGDAAELSLDVWMTRPMRPSFTGYMEAFYALACSHDPKVKQAVYQVLQESATFTIDHHGASLPLPDYEDSVTMTAARKIYDKFGSVDEAVLKHFPKGRKPEGMRRLVAATQEAYITPKLGKRKWRWQGESSATKFAMESFDFDAEAFKEDQPERYTDQNTKEAEAWTDSALKQKPMIFPGLFETAEFCAHSRWDRSRDNFNSKRARLNEDAS